MTDREALKERVAKAMCQEKCAFYGEPPCWGLDPNECVIEPWNPDTCDEPGCGALADAAIDLVMEEAARVADGKLDRDPMDDFDTGWSAACADIAAALRAYITPSGKDRPEDRPND